MTPRNPLAQSPAFLATLAAVGLAPFFYFTLTRYIDLDFWYDELTTLLLYACVPLKKTVTDYSFPNNHVFSNIVNNLFLRLVGLHDVGDVIQAPWAARALMLLYACLFLLLLFLVARRLWGGLCGVFCAVTAGTTIPFYNFATQVRGYVLSMTLLAAALWCLADYAARRRAASLLGLTLSGALLLYTIPVNLYALFALGLYCSARALGAYIRRAPDRAVWRNAVLALCLSVALACLFYAPVLHEVLGNRFVTSQGLFALGTLTETTPRMLGFFLSERLYLLPVVAAGLGLALFSPRLRPPLLGLFLVLVATPFVLSFARGDAVMYRLYVNLVGPFALLVTACLRAVCGLDALKRREAGVVGLLTAAMALSFVFAVRGLERTWAEDIADGTRNMDTYDNWHQAFYDTRDVVALLRAGGLAGSAPVSVMKRDVDELSMPWRLERAGIAHTLCEDDACLRFGPDGRALVVTGFPAVAQARLARAFPSLSCRLLTPTPRFHNVLKCALPPQP